MGAHLARAVPGRAHLSRRQLLLGSAGVAGAGALTVALPVAPFRLRRMLGLTPDPFVPDAAEGRVRYEQVRSDAMGGEIGLFTAVPAGFGDGGALPVVVVLHGASASAADLQGFGLPRFATAAVEAGAPPFVLAATDDGPSGWVPDASGNPQAMLRHELPDWLAERGYDAGRRVVWGWSRGGYGALRMMLAHPQWARAAALFSPAVVTGDPELADLSPLAGLPLGVWCGENDGFYDAVRDLVGRLPDEPRIETYGPGGHTRVYWNDHTVDALHWMARQLWRRD